jgi:hypothetical protein
VPSVAGTGATDTQLKLAGANKSDLNQEWDFDGLPNHPNEFLIRNAGNPLLCLDQVVADHKLVINSC